MKKAKAHTKQLIDKNPIESLLGIGGGVVKSMASDVAKGMGSDFWKQVVSVGNEKQKMPEDGGDLVEGQELTLANFANEQTEMEKKAKDLGTEAGELAVEYKKEILHGALRKERKTTQGIEIKIQEIVAELKRLTTTSKELQIEFKEVAIQQRVINPGKYHVNFFEWVLSIVRHARIKVEDSKAWLAAFQSKKNKREYWTMFKKHGTTFGLSNERIVATQTG